MLHFFRSQYNIRHQALLFERDANSTHELIVVVVVDVVVVIVVVFNVGAADDVDLSFVSEATRVRLS